MNNPRADEYFLMSSVMYPLLIVTGYLYFVNTWGPNFMKNRKPVEIKNILIIYNLTQIIFNMYLFLLVSSRSTFTFCGNNSEINEATRI
ncbi:hypothetical protein NQ314_008561 [Rhamnusium bicolor]|uniref:Very-long-chain 3-oxoacyl-CoA synthase n=1 Tax=Rhamnusium bicolor TaxID=1586634 RepID=A0AAV8YB16_9CUCU|nr:hypothetical protein NQ314_008561 [Rhamnusium bicolor]